MFRRSLRPFGCKALLVESGSVKTNILSLEKVLEEFDAAFQRMNSKNQRTEEGEKLLNAGEKEKEVYFIWKANRLAHQLGSVKSSTSIRFVSPSRFTINVLNLFLLLLFLVHKSSS